MTTTPMFFATPSDMRAWFEEHHDKEQELLVGYYKRSTGHPSVTWPESVDVALCFGWIDSVRRSIDEESYTNRFTPRKRRSAWSEINIKRVEELTRQGLMHPAGLRAFEARTEAWSGTYGYGRSEMPALDAEYEAMLRSNEEAWAFFEAQAPWYRRLSLHWVLSAKREETRRRRLATLIEYSAQGRRIPPLTRPTGSKPSAES